MKYVREHARTMVHRRIWSALGAMGLMLGVLSFSGAISQSAEGADTQPSIQMSTIIGFSGWYGKNHWVPVTVTLHNTGKAIDANLVLDTDYALDNGRSVSGNLYWPVKLSAHQDTSIQVAVPGEMIDSNASLECRVHNQVEAETPLQGNPLRNVSLVAVLSTQPQDLQFLMGSADGATGEPVLPVAVNPQTMPTSPSLFNNLTAAVATPWALDHLLTVQQQRALVAWVKLGGLLIVSGTRETSDWWQNQLPLYPGSPHAVSGVPLSVFTNSPSSTRSIQLTSYASGMNPKALAWAPADSKSPLIAALNIGRGKIVQTAFSPSEEPNLLSWANNAALWTSILKQGNAGAEDALPGLLDPSGVLNLATASNTLSPMRIPSLGVWATVFALYTLVVGPILFFFLRRYKRESMGWIVLPILSFVTTVGIWAFGASERPTGNLLAGVGVLDLIGDSSGGAETYGIEGFMSPIAENSAVVHTGQPMMLLPLMETIGGQSGSAKIVNTATHSTAEFSNIGRWRIRYVYAAGAVTGQGRIESTLETSYGMVSGVIMNDTKYHLHNVSMFWSGHMFMLGDLRPGEMVTISADTPTQDAAADWLSLYTTYNRDITRGVGHALGSFAASQNLMNVSVPDSRVLFVATTTDDNTPALPRIHERMKSTTRQTLVLVRQFSDVSVDETGVIS